MHKMGKGKWNLQMGREMIVCKLHVATSCENVRCIEKTNTDSNMVASQKQYSITKKYIPLGSEREE